MEYGSPLQLAASRKNIITYNHSLKGKKQSFEFVRKRAEAVSKGSIGKKLSKLHKKHISEALSNPLVKAKMITSHLGKKHCLEQNLKISEAVKRFWNSDYGKQRKKEIRAEQVLPVKDTSIEKIVESYLLKRGYEVVKHKPFRIGNSYHQVDRYLPVLNLAIECDGKYWHSKPEAIKRDNYINDHIPCDLIRLGEDDIRSREFEEMLGEWKI